MATEWKIRAREFAAEVARLQARVQELEEALAELERAAQGDRGESPDESGSET